jgi:hypothetical protein
MLRDMNRVLKQFSLAAFILAGTTIGLNACADDPGYQRGAAYPAAVPSYDDALAQNDVEVTGEGEVQATDAVAAPADGTATPATPLPPAYDPNVDKDPGALTDFQETLAPYGTWTDDGTYGRVWVPSSGVVGDDFAPYVTAGHWGVTDDNQYLWVSDYSWGWAPFHYGRWVWIGGRGWAWIPGRVYSPAWVVWRTGYYDDYYVGWAPMPPSWYWYGGFAVGLTVIPPAPYVFCSSRYVFYPGVRTYIVPATRVAVIGARTRPYVAATPIGTGGAAYHTMAMTRGPSFGAAHIPASAVPSQRVAPDQHAMAYSRAHPGSFVAPTYRAPAPNYRAPSYPAPNYRAAPGAGARPMPYSYSPRASVAPAPTMPRAAPPTRAAPNVVAPRNFSVPRARPSFRR